MRMHPFPNVEEVDRYITERLLNSRFTATTMCLPLRPLTLSFNVPRVYLATSTTSATTPCWPHILQANYRSAARSSRRSPTTSTFCLVARASPPTGGIVTGRAMQKEAAEDLWNNAARIEPVKPRMFTDEPNLGANGTNGHANGHANGHYNGSNGNTNGNGNASIFEILDDDISLELDGTFYDI